MPISLRSVAGSDAVPIGSSIYFAEGVPDDYTSQGSRYLVAGTIETDVSKFDVNIFRFSFLQPTVVSLTSVFGTDTIVGIAYNGTVFVALSNAGKVATSTDGNNWTPRSVPTPSNFTVGEIAVFVNGLFFVGGGGGSNSRLYSSTDGINWVERNVVFTAPNVTITGLAHNGSRYVAVSTSGHRSYSDNLTSWTAAGQGPSSGIRVAFGNGLFVHTSQLTAEVFTSTDGINWTSRPYPVSSSSSIAFGNGRFVIVGGSGTAYQSTDGINWTFMTNGASTSAIDRVIFAFGAFFAIGQNSYMGRSLDGLVFENLTTLGATATAIAAVTVNDVLVGHTSAVARRVLIRPYAGSRLGGTFQRTRLYIRVS
jgi:hypothetical protein